MLEFVVIGACLTTSVVALSRPHRAARAAVAVGATLARTPAAPPAGTVTPRPALRTGGAPRWYDSLPVPPSAPEPVRVPAVAGPIAPVYSRVPTEQPVAFLTIDDGLTRQPDVAPALRATGVPVTAFLISPLAAPPAARAYFSSVAGVTGSVEAHTVTHRRLPGNSYAFQSQQICGSADQLGQLFGRRPVLFRPPYGNYDSTTLRAAHDCGMRAVVTWTEVVENGKVAYQTSLREVRPGDILLLHFRATFPQDLTAALAAIRQAHLTPALLEDYLTDQATGGESRRPAGQPRSGA